MTEALSITMHNPVQGHQALAGKLWPHLKAHLTAGRRMKVTAEPQEDERSLQQNAYYWGVLLKEISEQAKINGTGATGDGWHLFFKRQFLGYTFKKVMVPGNKRPSVIKELRSTKGLSVKKMSIYLEQITALAQTDFGVMFSVPKWEEYRYER